jgi:tetratricopeptide (TPR) repeat protein
MRTKTLKIGVLLTAVIFVNFVNAALAQNGTSLTNPNVRNPVGSGTVPLTTYRSGLHATPNPIDRTSDLVVTGNVGGGRNFQGYLPYNAVSDFGGRLGSGTLDDFFRRSTIPQDYYNGGVAPFYSQTGTVTYIVPGTNMIIMPPSTKIRTEQTLSVGTGPARFGLQQEEKYPSSTIDLLGLNRTRFFPVNTDKLEQYKYLSEEEQAQREKSEQIYQQQYEEFTQELKGLSQEAQELKQRLDKQSITKESSTETGPQISVDNELNLLREPPEPLKPEEPGLPEQPLTPRQQQIDIYEKMLAEYKQSQEIPEAAFSEPEETEEQAKPNEAKPELNLSGRRLKYKAAAVTSTPEVKAKQQGEETEPMSDLEMYARERRVMSELKTFAAYSQDKFNQYMRAAEGFMQEGKYYQAADFYSLASIYKPQDPLAYAGRSHALFAAGEYLSSSLYLRRAIEMFNGYADFRIDIVTMIGGMDTVEKRISDIKGWIELSSAGELQFLLAYIYMQLDRLDKASEAVNAAYKQIPNVPAVGVLKAAIERRLSQ